MIPPQTTNQSPSWVSWTPEDSTIIIIILVTSLLQKEKGMPSQNNSWANTFQLSVALVLCYLQDLGVTLPLYVLVWCVQHFDLPKDSCHGLISVRHCLAGRLRKSMRPPRCLAGVPGHRKQQRNILSGYEHQTMKCFFMFLSFRFYSHDLSCICTAMQVLPAFHTSVDDTASACYTHCIASTCFWRDRCTQDQHKVLRQSHDRGHRTSKWPFMAILHPCAISIPTFAFTLCWPRTRTFTPLRVGATKKCSQKTGEATRTSKVLATLKPPSPSKTCLIVDCMNQIRIHIK